MLPAHSQGDSFSNANVGAHWFHKLVEGVCIQQHQLLLPLLCIGALLVLSLSLCVSLPLILSLSLSPSLSFSPSLSLSGFAIVHIHIASSMYACIEIIAGIASRNTTDLKSFVPS